MAWPSRFSILGQVAISKVIDGGRKHNQHICFNYRSWTFHSDVYSMKFGLHQIAVFSKERVIYGGRKRMHCRGSPLDWKDWDREKTSHAKKISNDRRISHHKGIPHGEHNPYDAENISTSHKHQPRYWILGNIHNIRNGSAHLQERTSISDENLTRNL